MIPPESYHISCLSILFISKPRTRTSHRTFSGSDQSDNLRQRLAGCSSEMAMMARSFLFVLSLALATAAPLPLPLPSLPSPSESPTPLPSSGRALASATNITGIPVNITEKIPFRVPPYNSTTSAVTSSNGTAANAPHIKTLQEEIAGGAGQFSFPTSKDTCEYILDRPVSELPDGQQCWPLRR